MFKTKAFVIAGFLTASVIGVHGAIELQLPLLPHLSLDLVGLLTSVTAPLTGRGRVIVRGDGDLVALAGRHQLPIVRRLTGGIVLSATAAEIASLANDTGITSISGDVGVRNSMAVSTLALAADQTRRGGSSGLLGLTPVAPVTGQGIVVAVVDSGISPHAALAGKVIANVSFVTDDPSTDDAFGHGTHVAGIITGTAVGAVNSLYTGGIAPGAQLVNVRVLGATGSGYTSDVIAGLDWVIANRTKYNIRVINLSLGHAVTEPAAFDPLCDAVARAVSAGIVVIVSAGNGGLSPDGQPVLGGITSPGNSPAAITVGALDTHATVARGDDVVAPYSSRGPTRFDLAVKPDVAAPGTRIVSLESSGSYLATHYPLLHRFGGAQNAYMQLSGTSMAAPMVSGAVALLLQGSPQLLPAQIKLAVQAGSTYMKDGGLMGAGAGSLNVWSSRRIAVSGLGVLPTSTIAGAVTTASGLAFSDAGTLTSKLYDGLGMRLLSPLQQLLAWANPSQLQVGSLNLAGVLNPLAQLPTTSLLYGEMASWTGGQTILWGSTIFNPSGQTILWGSGNQDTGQTILWGSTNHGADGQTILWGSSDTQDGETILWGS